MIDHANTPHFHIIIPTHNRVQLLNTCLQCLAVQDDVAFSVMVVDDGSSDGTAELLKEQYPSVEVIQGDGNLWWAGAVDAAIQVLLKRFETQPQRLQQDAIVLINDDTEFDADFLSVLRSIWRENPDTLVGSVVVNINDRSTITHGGAIINWLSAKLIHRNRGASIQDFSPEHVVEVSALTGRGVLIPLSVIVQVGSYNIAHFPQHGDYELPVRASRAGYQLKTFYKSIVYCHFELEGDVNTNKTYGFSDLPRLLTDQRSYLNLRERFWFAFDTRKNPLQFVLYLGCDMARVTKSVLQKLLEHYTKKFRSGG